MAYYANEAYNKQTSNEGFWESAGTGIGVGAATAAGVAAASHGASRGMMKFQNIKAANQHNKMFAQAGAAKQNLDKQFSARNLDFYAGEQGTIPVSPQVKAKSATDHASHTQAMDNLYQSKSNAIDQKYSNTRASRFHGKAFGGLKKTAVSYGGSALMGAITGGAIDYARNKK